MSATAHLRVYIPTEEASDEVLGLPEAEVETIEHWRNGEYGLLIEPPLEDAVFAEYKGKRYVCPRRPRRRMLESVLAFHNGFAGIGGHVIVPEATAIRAADELERLREVTGKSQILTSQWHVPLRWFLLFDPDEKLIGLAGPRPEMKYRTTRGAATARLERAVQALKRAGMEMVTEEMNQLIEWLDDFPESWLVELDYASVTDLFSEEDLLWDTTCEDLWNSVRGLEMGDPAEAHRWYEKAASRWAPVMMITYAN